MAGGKGGGGGGGRVQRGNLYLKLHCHLQNIPSSLTPFPPSLISLTVSVDVKHHVYYSLTPEWLCVETGYRTRSPRSAVSLDLEV